MTCETKIAILLATYNGEKYIEEQIDSLFKQSFQDFTIYVHDDGSSDSTKDIIDKIQRDNPDKLFVLEGPPTGGPKQNFMYLLKNVSADYYMFCDQDDVWKPKKIDVTYSKMVEAEKKNLSSPILVFSDLEVVDSKLKTISNSMNKVQQLNPDKVRLNDILCQNNITGCTVMINKELAKLSINTFNIENVIMHDWWIALIASRYGKIIYCAEQTILYRQHGKNNVGAKSIISLDYILKRLSNIQELKETIDKTRIQAEEFCDCFGIKDNELIYEYSILSEKNKIERLSFYIRYKVWKSGFIRNIGFLLFG